MHCDRHVTDHSDADVANLPPNDYVAEKRAIGCVLLDGQYQGISAVAAMELPWEDFYDGKNRMIWRAIQEAWERDGKIPTAENLPDVLKRRGAWNEEIRERIAHCVQCVDGICNLPIYIDKVRVTAGKRRLRWALTEAIDAIDSGRDVVDALRCLHLAGVIA